jgi:hypothetical protein
MASEERPCFGVRAAKRSVDAALVLPDVTGLHRCTRRRSVAARQTPPCCRLHPTPKSCGGIEVMNERLASFQ